MENNNFLLLLLDSGNNDLVRAYFMEKYLTVEEMKQVCNSNKRDIFLQSIHERLFSTTPLVPNTAEITVEEIKEEVSAPVSEETDKTSNEVDVKYLQRLEDCKVFHLASSDKASPGVRNSLYTSLGRMLSKNYFFVGQIIGKSYQELSLTAEAFSTLQKNIKRCDNIDIETSVEGLEEVLRPKVEEILQQKQEREETQKVSIILSLSLDEVEFFSPKSSFYKKLSKTEKNLLTRLKGKLVMMGVKSLSEIIDCTEDDFQRVLELPHKYYELFLKIKAAI